MLDVRCSPSTPRPGPLLPGQGLLEFSLAGRRTVVTRAAAATPLKLLTPRSRGPSAWAFTSTHGGGMVAGDDVRLSLRAGPGTTGFLGTQSATKVYRSPAGVGCRQSLDAAVEDGATLVVAPDPITCFADARFEQRLRFDLAASASLVLIDWLTSGRRARGERWAFAGYRSRLDLAVAGRAVLADALRLCPQDGPLASPRRLGPADCLALVVLAGPRLADEADRLLKATAAEPVRRLPGLLTAAGPLPGGGGAVLRAAGASTEAVGRWLRERLAFLPGVLGEDPWARKG